MGSSTIKLQRIVNALASMPDVNPTVNPGSYATDTVLDAATDTMNDLISSRFNFKWNSAQIAPFLTNGWQQDYPMAGLSDMGWLESAFWIEANTPQRPVPFGPLGTRRDLCVDGSTWTATPTEICWLYNKQLQLGSWPGPGTVFAPLRGTVPATPQNAQMSMRDLNGNILVLLTPGKTGLVPPAAPRNAVEGMTVPDGTATWVVCAVNSQGFRISPIPSATSPVLEIHVTYQQKAVPFTDISQTLGNLPDDYAHHFRNGFRITCHKYSSDPRSRDKYEALRGSWLGEIAATEKQGEREPDSFRLLPATGVVASVFGNLRDPRDPSRPY